MTTAVAGAGKGKEKRSYLTPLRMKLPSRPIDAVPTYEPGK